MKYIQLIDIASFINSELIYLFAQQHAGINPIRNRVAYVWSPKEFWAQMTPLFWAQMIPLDRTQKIAFFFQGWPPLENHELIKAI